jgi:hypothetical protein
MPEKVMHKKFPGQTATVSRQNLLNNFLAVKKLGS